MAFITLAELSASGPFSNSPRILGTICQDTPYLSFNQPQGCSSPPSESFSHNSSTSAWVSQCTKNEMASVNLNSGPPFNAMNSCPSSSNVAVMTVPAVPGPSSPYRLMLPILEFLKIEV